MNYFETYISRPISYDEDFPYLIKDKGDSYFVTAVEYTPTFNESVFPPAKPIPITTIPSVHLLQSGEDLVGAITEGGVLNFSVGLSEAHTADIVVDVTMSYAPESNFPQETVIDTVYLEENTVEETYDWIGNLTISSDPIEWDTTVVQVTIPAGDLQATGSFTHTDDAVISNKIKVSRLTITAIDTVDYMINNNYDTGLVFVKESLLYPKWSGNVEVWCRSHKITHLERVLDPDTSAVSTFTFGFDTNTDLTLKGESNLESVQIDDIPIHELVFRPVKLDDGTLEPALDIESPSVGGTAIDLTTVPPLYRLVIRTGRRS